MAPPPHSTSTTQPLTSISATGVDAGQGWSETSRLVAAARHAAAVDAATAAAAERDGGHAVTDHLTRLLATAPAIEQAKGLLMGYYGVDADTAYALLRRWSSQANLKVSRLAEQLLSAASQPAERPSAGCGSSSPPSTTRSTTRAVPVVATDDARSSAPLRGSPTARAAGTVLVERGRDG